VVLAEMRLVPRVYQGSGEFEKVVEHSEGGEGTVCSSRGRKLGCDRTD
jgi:hypothetical protein